MSKYRAQINRALPVFHYIEKYVIALVGIALFVVLAAIWLLLKRLPNTVRSMFATSWPLVEGRVETAAVETIGEQALVELGYSYSTAGNRYSGYFSQQFADEQQAWDYAKKLQGRSVIVRHGRSNPAVSVLRFQDQRLSDLFKGVGLLTAVWTAFLSATRELHSSRRSEGR